MFRVVLSVFFLLAATVVADEVKWPMSDDGVEAEVEVVRHAMEKWLPKGKFDAVPLVAGMTPETLAVLEKLKEGMAANPAKAAALIAGAERGKPLPYREWFGVTEEEYEATVNSKPKLVPSGPAVKGTVTKEDGVTTLDIDGEPTLRITFETDNRMASVVGQPEMKTPPTASTRDNTALGIPTQLLSWDMKGGLLGPSGGFTLMRGEDGQTVAYFRRRGLTASSNARIVYQLVAAGSSETD